MVDDCLRTTVDHIFAIGDVTAKLGLAHTASAQGLIAAEAIAGRPTPVLDYRNIPRCVYAYPEVASVGLTEAEARENGFEVQVKQSPFVPNGKAFGHEREYRLRQNRGPGGHRPGTGRPHGGRTRYRTDRRPRRNDYSGGHHLTDGPDSVSASDLE